MESTIEHTCVSQLKGAVMAGCPVHQGDRNRATESTDPFARIDTLRTTFNKPGQCAMVNVLLSGGSVTESVPKTHEDEYRRSDRERRVMIRLDFNVACNMACALCVRGGSLKSIRKRESACSAFLV
jgi:hypothetical protein